MLVLTRKINETIHAGPVAITVCRIDGGKVRIGIDAPRVMPICRGELLARQQASDNMTLPEIVNMALQPGFRDDKEAMYTALSAAISLLADADKNSV